MLRWLTRTTIAAAVSWGCVSTPSAAWLFQPSVEQGVDPEAVAVFSEASSRVLNAIGTLTLALATAEIEESPVSADALATAQQEFYQSAEQFIALSGNDSLGTLALDSQRLAEVAPLLAESLVDPEGGTINTGSDWTKVLSALSEGMAGELNLLQEGFGPETDDIQRRESLSRLLQQIALFQLVGNAGAAAADLNMLQ